MKKILLFGLVIVLSLVFIGCQNTLTSNSTTILQTQESTTDIPTTQEPYDPRGLVSEECSIIDNIGDWQPVWCDEFSNDGLPDSDKWLYDVGGQGWGNNELQYYTREDLDNVFIEDGILNIRAIKESYMGNEYTSGRIVTKYQGDWTYGRIQVRAKVPEGRGTWPAVWMLPTNNTYGGWPYSGEIDIMEYVGYDPDTIHGTIHTGAYNHGLNTQIGYTTSVSTAEEEFHVYEMIWEPSSIIMFIDGVQFATFGYNANTNIDILNSDAWPFDQPFHLILNLAIGGNWGGVMGVDDSIFPATFQVDYVRVFQKDYAGLDEEAPTSPTQLILQDRTHDELRLKWNRSTDDVLVSHYNIYVNETLVDTTTLNAIRIYELEANTNYSIYVEAEDFAGNKSEKALLTTSTEDVPLALGIIQAEDYTRASGVQIEQSTDTDGTKNLGYIDNGDSMTYLLRVEEAGEYQINFRVASLSDGGTIELYTKNRFPLFTMNLPVTGGWQDWTTVTTETFTLQEGIYEFTFQAVQGGFNLNYFEIIGVE